MTFRQATLHDETYISAGSVKKCRVKTHEKKTIWESDCRNTRSERQISTAEVEKVYKHLQKTLKTVL